MNKVEARKVSFLQDGYDDQEKEVYLNELGDAVHSYIKTGVKSKQLDELLSIERQFQKKYEQRFNIKKITDSVFVIEKEAIDKFNAEKACIEINSEKQYDDKDVASYTEKRIRALFQKLEEAIDEHLQTVLKDAAYLSHINMLYELYEREEALRKEQKEFEEISLRFPDLEAITAKINEHRRLEIKEAEEKTGFSQETITHIVGHCNKYFNIRDKKNSIQISLSSDGKKYTNYVSNCKINYTSESLNQMIYQNCDRMISSLENSYERGNITEVKLEGLMPDKERVIKHKFYSVLQELIASKSDIYTYAAVRICKEDEDETDRIEIPREWTRRTY